MAAGGVQRVYLGTQQVGFAIFYDDVTIHQLDFLLAQAFDLPTEKRNASLVTVTQKIVMSGFLVNDNGVVRSFIFFCFGHGVPL